MTKVYITESGYKLNVASTLRMTASEAETLLDGVFEPVLGNPVTNGYVLSSTTAGVRSWVAQSGGGGDVGDLTTTTGSSTNMLRVAAAGGLEYRTTAQVIGDIGAAPTASPTFTGTVTLPTTVASVIKPSGDSTTALRLTKADGTTSVLTVDTTNRCIAIGATSAAGYALRVAGGYVEVQNTTLSVTGTYGYVSFGDGGRQFRIDSSTESYFDVTGSGAGVLRFRLSNSFTTVAFWATSGLRFWINAAIGQNAVPTAAADLAASTTAAASLRIRSGTAPTTPNAGDVWFDGTNLKFYDGTATRTISWT